jgi:PQQ-dependent catabolism-associated CXXCW motif protein
MVDPQYDALRRAVRTLAPALAGAALGLVVTAAAATAAAPPAGASNGVVAGFGQFERADGHKAFAVNAAADHWGGAWKRDTAFRSLTTAIWTCNRGAKAPCRGYMVDDVLLEPDYAAFEAASRDALATVRGATLRSPPFAEEERDFGIAPTGEIRRSDLHAPTPRTIAGARAITTTELVALLKAPTPPILIDVLDADQRHTTLPTAWWWRAAGNYANDKEDALNDLLRALLASAVPDKATPLVFFCQSSRCWLSHNAALRALAAGYTTVMWYRGGIDAWRAANLPFVKAVLTAQLW